MAVNQKQTERNSLELYTEWYLQELKENGYVIDFYREPFTYEVIPDKMNDRYNCSKTKYKIEQYKIMSKLTYTPDYIIVWHPSAQHIFFNLLDGSPIRIWCPFYAFLNQEKQIVSICDVKPMSDMARNSGQMSSLYTFPLIQKMMLAFNNIYVNKTIPIPVASKGKVKSGNTVALFTTTFCPTRYTFTDSGKQARLIHYRTKTLQMYVKIRNQELATISALIDNPTLL